MPSDRLYYTDAYLTEFDAVVRDVRQEDGRWTVTLDRTAFYPTSGGQPFDTGVLDEVPVVDVVEREDGTVAHVVEREIEKNARVRGRIDWARRFDHMQQHTGQHLLSAAFERVAAARTVSFHLGASAATIDIDRELPPDRLVEVEQEANRVLFEDRDVATRFVTAAEAAALPLRKEPVRTGELRIIEIADYDMSACGGTHVSRTGAIGLIAISASERFKGGQRIEFMCGDRARRAFRGLRQAVDGSVRLLSVLPDELPAAIERLQVSLRAQQKQHEALQDRLARLEAERLLSSAESVGTARVVAAVMPEWGAAGLKKLASAIAADPHAVAVLATAEAPVALVVARGQDLTFDAGSVMRGVIAQLGGKGGGKGGMAQGGGFAAQAQAVVDAAQSGVSAELTGAAPSS